MPGLDALPSLGADLLSVLDREPAGGFAALSWGPNGGSGGSDEPLLTQKERRTLAAGAWLAALPPWVAADVLRPCRVRNLRAGEGVLLGGEGLALCGVASGALSVRLRRPHSEVLDHVPAGAWLVDAGRAAAPGSLLVLQAHRRATVVTLGADALAQLARRHDRLQPALVDLGWAYLARLMAILEDQATLPLRPRIARCLVRLCDGFGLPSADGVRVALALNQTEMAAVVRASRQRLNQELKTLESEGLLRVEKELLVLDLEALRARA